MLSSDAAEMNAFTALSSTKQYGLACELQPARSGLRRDQRWNRQLDVLKALRKHQTTVKTLPRPSALLHAHDSAHRLARVGAKSPVRAPFLHSFSTFRIRPGRTDRTAEESCRWDSDAGIRDADSELDSIVTCATPRKRESDSSRSHVNLMALLTRFITIRRNFSSSPYTKARSAGISRGVEAKADALCSRISLECLNRHLADTPNVERRNA